MFSDRNRKINSSLQNFMKHSNILFTALTITLLFCQVKFTLQNYFMKIAKTLIALKPTSLKNRKYLRVNIA